DVPFAGFVLEMQSNAANVSKLLNDMLDSLYDEFQEQIYESNDETKQLEAIIEIFNKPNLSIRETLEEIEAHKEDIVQFSAEYEAVKKLETLHSEAEAIANGLFFSRSKITHRSTSEEMVGLIDA